MTSRPRRRRTRRSARRKPGGEGAPAAQTQQTLAGAPAQQAPAAAPAPARRTTATERATRGTPLAVKGPRSLQPGPGGTIRRLVVAGLLLGPGLGIALGPWLASGRLPLFESRISWQGA